MIYLGAERSHAILCYAFLFEHPRFDLGFPRKNRANIFLHSRNNDATKSSTDRRLCSTGSEVRGQGSWRGTQRIREALDKERRNSFHTGMGKQNKKLRTIYLVCILRSSIRFTLPSSVSSAPKRRFRGSFCSLINARADINFAASLFM